MPTAKDQINVSAGNYEVIVRDNRDCEITRIISVPEKNLTVEVEIINPCHTFQKVNVHANGGVPPYTYNWEPKTGIKPEEANQINLRAGDYTFTVTDNNGCELIQSVNLWESLNLDIERNHPSCPTASDGNIVLNTQGGTPPYQYQWEGPNLLNLEKEDQNNLMAGTCLLYTSPSPRDRG